jgi:hypothetical protein
MQQEMDINFYGPVKGVVWRNLAKIAMTCYAKEITMSLCVGTLPDGYVRTNPLQQVPTKQSVQTSRIPLPPYFGLVIGHAIWQDILAIIAKRHDSLNASR